ncbi:MFS general substrate transporter [Trichodelitschia bisporula]|uniref:MFS general substrate transporter n=1 Tax=Trichodelitschia bisporula TaxID=703511 RepID=A0A6G1HUV8_9PEZI|nr:MFS general substrate transporter [Trichodelitschia bisporula]
MGSAPSAATSVHELDIDLESAQSPSASPSLSDSKSHSPPPPRPESRASTTFAVPVVPKHLRRGLFARFALIPETPQPTLYTRRTKWSITALIALCAAAAPMGSAIIMPSLLIIASDFNSSPTVTNLAVALYMLSMSIFPLWWSSFSETLGRRTIYVVSFTLFVLFSILSAVSNSIGMLIVMRVLSGGAAASVQAVGAGTIADIWEPRERGRAMGIFYLGPLCGPLFAPIIGGALAQGLGWRSTQWFTAIYGAVVLAALIFLLPETLRQKEVKMPEAKEEKERPSASLRRTTTAVSVVQGTKRTAAILRRCFLDPLRIILLLRFPAVAITVYYASITFGSLYFLNISVEETFSDPPYGFSTLIVGLCYIPMSVGYILASVGGGRWLDHIMKREARKADRIDADGKLIFRPEDRMRENAWMSAVMFPLALVWYGWSAEKHTHWIVPLIANFFFGLGSMIVFAMATTMLTEFMPRKASTGIAVNNFVRNIFSCVGGIVAHPLIKALGNGWLCTILAIVALISGCVVIWAMKHYGDRWREEMDRKMEDW